MSNQSFAAEQLLELLLQLKKTTPAAARSILNGQPQIAYALMTLMVTLNAVNFDVFQKTLAEFGSKSAAPALAPAPTIVAPSAHPSTSSTPIPALPPHLHAHPQAYRNATPPSQPQAYTYQNGHHHQQHYAQAQPYTQPQPYQQPQPNAGYASYAHPPPPPPTQQHQPQPQSYANYPGYGAPPPAPAPAPAQTQPSLSDTLAAIPEEQKALIMRVITMTPEQIHALPPTERQTYIQLRATLGVPT